MWLNDCSVISICLCSEFSRLTISSILTCNRRHCIYIKKSAITWVWLILINWANMTSWRSAIKIYQTNTLSSHSRILHKQILIPSVKFTLQILVLLLINNFLSHLQKLLLSRADIFRWIHRFKLIAKSINQESICLGRLLSHLS